MMHHRKRHSPDTEALHAGSTRKTGERAIATPIWQTTTFRFASLDELAAQVRGENALDMYTRYSHPNHRAVEEKLAAMEGAEAAVCFASGMAAAATTIMALCAQGNTIVSFRDVYGGTYRLLTEVLPRFGISARFVPTGDYAAMEDAVDATTQLVIAETPTNPLVRVVEIARIAEIGRQKGVVTLIDNTFATPINQQPLRWGVDLVLHSGTKYLGGHSDVMAGLVAGDATLISRIREVHKVLGAVLDPHAAFLLERGIKSLGARVVRHNANAQALAEMLAAHPKVSRVFYPGLPDSPDHAVARRQMRGFGGMLAFDLVGGYEAADRFCRALKIGQLAVSLGAVETLVSPPALTSHVMLTPQERAAAGITDGTLRVSVGIEDTDDLVEDFRQALEAA